MPHYQYLNNTIYLSNDSKIIIYYIQKNNELTSDKEGNDVIYLVKNNKVITTMSADDMQGNIFTNIDSTVIM